ncbi:hypothetical protein C5F52_28470 [Limnohabitans sp. TS-CS-82]|jgi:hypothetical protein|uniref:hypothetical protein n=1 Tax=Limnohabitans sp. TS-CS-82 TaxID=2094193 RepID=UPI000CF219AC|nr:hypothetical protein [Limnohabitans sp. TS-CS-82]PQA79821.1 hypothetical protein C5F52_28470 [Limnohabitans sp. TS-CS-82]
MTVYRPRWIAVLLLMVCSVTWATKPLPGWKALGSSEIEDLFKGKVLGDGFHYSYRFQTNGSLSGVEMAKDVRGTWAVEKKLLCLHREKPRRFTECFEVHANGRDINMLDRGGLVFRGNLLDLEPSQPIH